MTRISSSYYQLANALTGQNNSSSNSLGTKSSSGTSTTQSLIDALSAADGTGSQASNAYSLNLSPEAQRLLGSSNSSSSSTSSNFTLTHSQQKKIEDILQQFAGQPLTQDTYDKIQQALQKAGLSANQLRAQDEITNLASPQTLIDDLNGNIDTSFINPTNIISTEQTKASNYMDAIVKEWQSMNASSPSSTTTDTTSQS